MAVGLLARLTNPARAAFRLAISSAPLRPSRFMSLSCSMEPTGARAGHEKSTDAECLSIVLASVGSIEQDVSVSKIAGGKRRIENMGNARIISEGTLRTEDLLPAFLSAL